jgi:hypothetical protein
MHRRTAKWLSNSFIALSFSTLLFVLFLDNHFCYRGPYSPQPLTGNVYRKWVCHGTVVYLSRVQYYGLEFAGPLMFLFFIVGAFIHNRYVKQTPKMP